MPRDRLLPILNAEDAQISSGNKIIGDNAYAATLRTLLIGALGEYTGQGITTATKKDDET